MDLTSLSGKTVRIYLRRYNNSISYKIARHACGSIDIHDPAQAKIISLGSDENGKERTAVLVKSFNEEHQQENEEARLLTFDLGPYMKYFNVTSENGDPKIFYDTIEFEHGTCNTTINVTDMKTRFNLFKVVEIKAITGTCHSFKHLEHVTEYKYCPYASKEIVGIDASNMITYDKEWKEFKTVEKMTRIDVLKDGEVRSLQNELKLRNIGYFPLTRNEKGEEELAEDIHRLCNSFSGGSNNMDFRRHPNSVSYKLSNYGCGVVNIHDPKQAEIIDFGNGKSGIRVKALSEKHQREDDQTKLVTFNLDPYMKYVDIGSENTKQFYDEIKFDHGTCNSTINVTRVPRDRISVEIKAINETCHSIHHLENDSSYKYCPYAEKKINGIGGVIKFTYDEKAKIIWNVQKIIYIEVFDRDKGIKALNKDISMEFDGTQYLKTNSKGVKELREDIQ
uniref:CSON012563 protein n=1 Tax=Culicoides sonorensis TaxID=179676 RepID=A0A336LHU8_CULSO